MKEDKTTMLKISYKIHNWKEGQYFCDLHIKCLKRYELDLATRLIRHCGIDYHDLEFSFDSRYDHIWIYSIPKPKADEIINSKLLIKQVITNLNN